MRTPLATQRRSATSRPGGGPTGTRRATAPPASSRTQSRRWPSSNRPRCPAAGLHPRHRLSSSSPGLAASPQRRTCRSRRRKQPVPRPGTPRPLARTRNWIEGDPNSSAAVTPRSLTSAREPRTERPSWYRMRQEQRCSNCQCTVRCRTKALTLTLCIGDGGRVARCDSAQTRRRQPRTVGHLNR